MRRESIKINPWILRDYFSTWLIYCWNLHIKCPLGIAQPIPLLKIFSGIFESNRNQNQITLSAHFESIGFACCPLLDEYRACRLPEMENLSWFKSDCTPPELFFFHLRIHWRPRLELKMASRLKSGWHSVRPQQVAWSSPISSWPRNRIMSSKRVYYDFPTVAINGVK